MTPDNSIQLSLPGTSRHVALARLLAGGVASMGGMPMTSVEDARIVVDEVCISLLEIGGGNPVSLTLSFGPGGLRIEGTTKDTRLPNRRRSAISHQILDVLTDHHRLTQEDGHATLSATVPTRH